MADWEQAYWRERQRANDAGRACYIAMEAIDRLREQIGGMEIGPHGWEFVDQARATVEREARRYAGGNEQ